jgi:hypothetical protein
MSQPPYDWLTQPYLDEDESEDEGEIPPPPPPAPGAPKKASRATLDSKKEDAREKLMNYESMLEATRFVASAIEALAVCARDDLKRMEKRKPRAPTAAAPAAAGAAAALPPASQAAAACEEAVVGKHRVDSVKRVRAALTQAPIGAEVGCGGAAAGPAVHHHVKKQRGGA